MQKTTRPACTVSPAELFIAQQMETIIVCCIYNDQIYTEYILLFWVNYST